MSERDGRRGGQYAFGWAEYAPRWSCGLSAHQVTLPFGPVRAGHDSSELSVGRVLRETLATLSRLSFVQLSFVTTVGRETTPER